MLGAISQFGRERNRRMKRSGVNGEDAPHAKRKKTQPGDLDMQSTQDFAQLQSTVTEEQESIIERPYSTQSAECGVIEKILLINFMCHNRLEVNFNTNVNFVHGRNGSGKSAIMTATVVGLGGKATATSRGSSLKNFIQNGAGFAEISIWLKNGGPDAYRPEVYGGSIEVVRRIMADGAGMYKIKSCRGQVVSSKKEELTNILDQFNIQVDNPVSLLNQDTSRNFLHVTDAKAKYKLFMRATQLDHIAHEFERIEAACTRHKALVASKEKEIESEKVGIKELEDQWKSLERLSEMEGQVDHLRQEMKWAYVRQIEMSMQEDRARIDKENEKIPAREQKLRELEASRHPVMEQKASYEGQLRSVVDQLKEMEEEKRTFEEDKRAKERVHVEKLKHCRQRTKSRARVENEKKALQKKIDEMKEKQRQKDIQNTKTAERARWQMDLDELKRKVSELKERKSSHVELRSQLEHSLEENRRQNADKRRQASSLAQKISEQQHTIRRLQSARSDRLRGFGEWMPQVIQAINQAGHQFSQKPLGPVGAYLKVKNEKYAFAVECALGGPFLTSFFCNSHRDRAVLLKIFHQVIRNKQAFPEIITAPFQNHPYRDAPLPRVPYPTVMSMLAVDNVLVGNQLLERKMNAVLLIDTASEARQFMFSRPPGYHTAYTLDGDQAMVEGKFYSGPYRKQAVYLQASNEEAVRELEREMQQWVNEKQALESSLSSVGTQEEQDRAELRRLQQLVAQESQQERTLSKKMMYLETELAVCDEEEEDGEFDIGTLEDEIGVLDQDVLDITEDIRAAEEEAQQVKEEVVGVENSIAAIQGRINFQIGEVENLNAEIQRLERDLGKVDYRCDQYRQKIAELHNNIAKLERDLEQQQVYLESATQDAAALSKERIETKKTPEALDRQIKQLTRLLATEKDSLKDLEEVRTKFHQKLSWYRETVQHMEESKRLLKRTKIGMKMRYDAFVSVQEMITLRAAMYFKSNLEGRNYIGELLFDHEKETLELKVQVDTSAAKSSAKNQKALSGGERSFATVCFIMSLWDAIEAPFRVLDEFDVFMDMVNRKMSMRMLLQSAEKSAGRQYIFLTPQNMSDLVPMDKSRLSVFVLDPPERDSGGN